MDHLYITNYCDRRCTPFQSITRLDTDAAYSLAKDYSQHVGSTFNSFSRFCDKDFQGYYEKRIRTEKWLYRSFMELGGKPKLEQPLYFVLGESHYLNEWFADGHKHRLSLRNIHSDDISFTFGDSMSMMDSPDRMAPFTTEGLIRFISKSAANISDYLAELDTRNKYVEAQLWNDEYIKSIME